MLVDHLDRFVTLEPEALVFTNAAGRPLSHSSFQTHHFRKAQLAAGVSCRFHDLRHTSVALAIAEGAHPKAIQARMGQSSITVTLDRYGHLFPSSTKRSPPPSTPASVRWPAFGSRRTQCDLEF
jgi:integrase